MYYRRKAREIALQVLYELDVLKMDTQEAVDLFWDHFTAAEEALEPFWDYFQTQRCKKACLEGLWSTSRCQAIFNPFN